MIAWCLKARTAYALLVCAASVSVLSCNQMSGLDGFTLRDEHGSSPDGGGEATCTKYVSASGLLNGHGSFTSIQVGVNTLQPGETLCVGPGTYFETVRMVNSGTSDKPITLTAFPGASPIVDGAGVQASDWIAVIRVEGNYIAVSGFEVRNARWTGGRGVHVLGQRNTVSNMNVHHAQMDGIFVTGDHNTVENCQVWQNAQVNTLNPGYWGSGLVAARDEQGDGITANAILRGNIVYDNWGQGLATFEARGTILEDNVIYNNRLGNVAASNASDVIIRRNLIYNTPDSAFESRSGLSFVDLRPEFLSSNNTVVNNLFFGAWFCAFCWTDVDGAGLDSMLIANNTLYNTALQTGPTNSNGRVVNNIIQSVDSVVDVPSKAGLTFTSNLWSKTPPANAAGPGDVIGDPVLAQSGTAGPGQLSGAWFKLLNTSPAVDAGATVPDVTDDYFRTHRPVGEAFDIGAHELEK